MKPLLSSRTKRVVAAILAVILVSGALGYWGGAWGTVLAAVLIVVTSGAAIAYLGDIIGYSLGKKRVSFRGIRPRDTATVVGVAAGGLSALVAFAILLGINAGFREALVRGNEIVRNLLVLKKQNTALEQEVAKSSEARRQAETGRTKAQAEAQVAIKMDAEAQAGLRAARAEMARAQKALDTAQVQLTATRSDLHATQSSLQQRQAALDLAAADLNRARRTVKLAEVRADDLSVKNQAALNRLHEITGLTIPTIESARSSEVVYRNGQEVGRLALRNGSTDSLVKSLEGFLDTLGRTAEDNGAGRVNAGRAVKIATIQLTSLGQTGHDDTTSPVFASEAESIEALAEQIHATESQSVVVIAYAVGNAFAKERVVVRLRPFRNRLVIPEGKVLAETTLRNPSAMPASELMTEIQRLLVMKVRPAAIGAGLIPVLESAHAQAQLGDLPLSDIFTILKQIESTPGDVILTAATAKDTWSADKLQLRFTVRPVPAAATPDVTP
jgi:uncharacterized protein (DUF3084 family)